MSLRFHESVVEALRRGRRLVVATVIETVGSVPRRAGACMAILEDGTILESVGGGALEALVVQDALALLVSGGSEIKEYSLKDGPEPESTGMVCGGRVRVHLRAEFPPERLVIFGAGHVGAALAALAPGLGFAATVVDDREDFLEAARLPAEVTRFCAGRDFAGDLPRLDGETFVAVVTRCHRSDLAALRRILPLAVRYVGLIGSRRKIHLLAARLRDEGIPAERLEQLRAPIGLPIGACTPAEIAVSIAAELIQIRRASAAVGERPGRLRAERVEPGTFRQEV
jgi:xanthine dehydrogenase accessory factor